MGGGGGNYIFSVCIGFVFDLFFGYFDLNPYLNSIKFSLNLAFFVFWGIASITR